jgi:pimeloyl-ACP methyl ester carboxylesterase
LATNQPALADVLRQPTLVLAGDDDPIVPLGNGRILTRLLPRARLEIVAGGGHLFVLERPAEIARLVDGFLDDPEIR